jgi:hypothetical protein
MNPRQDLYFKSVVILVSAVVKSVRGLLDGKLWREPLKSWDWFVKQRPVAANQMIPEKLELYREGIYRVWYEI